MFLDGCKRVELIQERTKLIMKKIILLVAMLAMLVVSAAPAFAQTVNVDVNGIGAEAENIGIETDFSVNAFNPVATTDCFASGWWGAANFCPAVVVQEDNELDVVQFVSGGNEFFVDDNGFTIFL